MRNTMIYVHYEPLAHLFLTAGLSASDVLAASKAPFRHLLLLPPVSDTAFIDPHTGFNEISGAEAVTAFLRSKQARDRAWLDYKHGSYLRELTPNEIAELLYLGHAKTHIQPPYYYKLQNQVVYLPLANDMVTLYVRKLDLFSQTLSAAIVRHLRLAANDQPFWLRLRQLHVPAVPNAVIAALYPEFEEGLMLDFSRGVFSRDQVKIPLAHNLRRFMPEQALGPEQVVRRGDLVLVRATGQWRVNWRTPAEQAHDKGVFEE
ncbi:hypothetical protein [Lacticaseibacillus daqingensis]|uniref:hypothetical protein n=1 Tax=Lacticaseibacillus daqingensis TaxID=2486014 RepID=UPI000F799BA7|nr:hypothetical protein [Lacticaseibacillus daqingensis]